ncbi:hypothetical protein EDB89DRAFT_844120 [Lactarius sanguifluus]|nr:hypothetical protein EDB89DRAFT_844120 [Lactarius sanguifluus]
MQDREEIRSVRTGARNFRKPAGSSLAVAILVLLHPIVCSASVPLTGRQPIACSITIPSRINRAYSGYHLADTVLDESTRRVIP